MHSIPAITHRMTLGTGGQACGVDSTEHVAAAWCQNRFTERVHPLSLGGATMTDDARYWATIRAELDAVPAQTLTPAEYMAYVADMAIRPLGVRSTHLPGRDRPLSTDDPT